MGRRWALLLFGVLLLTPALACASCSGKGICEIGETGQTPPCGDCLNAVCGNNRCDQGLGEHLYGQTTWCQSDCGLPNGQACTTNSQCLSGNCCFSGSTGVCVATMGCQPGNPQACNEKQSKLRTCTNQCAWGACSQNMACGNDVNCDDNNICATTGCSEVPARGVEMRRKRWFTFPVGHQKGDGARQEGGHRLK